MTWDVVWTNRALKDADVLDRRVKLRVLTAIEQYAESGQGNAKPLRGTHSEWRLRVGDWRVRFAFDRATNTMTVLRVLPRGRAYRD